MTDEIYDLFLWDSTLSFEEYEARIARGMELAGQVRYLYPFLQPILPQPTKAHCEPCARVLSARSDAELEPYLYRLFEWLQDMNWPGAERIWDRLLQIPFLLLAPMYRVAVSEARRTKDEGWLKNLEAFRKEAQKQEKP